VIWKRYVWTQENKFIGMEGTKFIQKKESERKEKAVITLKMWKA
jgi:hypothetical protein